MIKTGKLRLRRWTLTFLKGQAAFAIEQMNDNKAGAKIIDRISVFTFEGKE